LQKNKEPSAGSASLLAFYNFFVKQSKQLPQPTSGKRTSKCIPVRLKSVSADSGLTPPTPQRSRIMSAIRSKGNQSTERVLATLLRRHKIGGWRRHLNLPGKPDYVFSSQRVAVFVDGCFWHGCPRCYKEPKKNVAFWSEKLVSNKRRDRRVDRKLRTMGWRVLRVWEHSLLKGHELSAVNRIQRAVSQLKENP
jgi:DNA mismatch endonuclease (patch repair protein)